MRSDRQIESLTINPGTSGDLLFFSPVWDYMRGVSWMVRGLTLPVNMVEYVHRMKSSYLACSTFMRGLD